MHFLKEYIYIFFFNVKYLRSKYIFTFDFQKNIEFKYEFVIPKQGYYNLSTYLKFLRAFQF